MNYSGKIQPTYGGQSQNRRLKRSHLHRSRNRKWNNRKTTRGRNLFRVGLNGKVERT